MATDIGTRQHFDPLPYHDAIHDYLKREEAPIWRWYASNRVRQEHAEALRLELLKSTYRVSRETQPDLYAMADEVSSELGLAQTPITIYQAQDPAGLNASLAYLPGEAHIVLHGPIATKLAKSELRALLAHELGHMLLYRQWDGELLIAEQVLAAMTRDRDADTPHFASARLFGLYTEVFCDRVALGVTGKALDVVSMFVKVSTGLVEVDPTEYLQQADEILKNGPVKTEGISHPEAFIRAHVLQLWQDQGRDADSRIAKLIEGKLVLDEMDLLAQERVAGLTRRLIDALLAPSWLRTDVVMAHARLFFDEYEPPLPDIPDESLRKDIDTSDKTLRDYFCYVMLDFATADRELEEAPLAQAIDVAQSLGLNQPFADIAAKELRLRKKQMEKITADRQTIIAAAFSSEATP